MFAQLQKFFKALCTSTSQCFSYLECDALPDSASNCTVLYYLTFSLVFPSVFFLYKLAGVCTVVFVVYNNIPVPDFTHSYVKCYLKIIIWKCYLM